jgi:hypothetical protein
MPSLLLPLLLPLQVKPAGYTRAVQWLDVLCCVCAAFVLTDSLEAVAAS